MNEDYAPYGQTSHLERDETGTWWVVWLEDFPGSTSGRKEHSQSWALEDAYQRGYKQGKKDGIRLFAWWKDGVQYVGTTGTTLEKALKEVDEQ